MSELGQNQSGPVMKNMDKSVDNAVRKSNDEEELRKKYPEYFEDNNE